MAPVHGELLFCRHFLSFRNLDTMRHARSGCPFSPSDCHYSSPRRSRRRTVGCCRIRSRQTATPDPESFPEAVIESARKRSNCCRLVCSPHPSSQADRSAIVLKPSTLLRFHQALRNRKYRLLFSPKLRKKPGPKGPNPEVIAAVIEMKQRNPTWGCPRIAQQICARFV